MALSAVTTIDEQDTIPLKLGKFDVWQPTSHNDETAQVELSTQWLTKQRCPYHPDAVASRPDGKLMGFTHYRAHWARIRMPSGALTWRPAVMLRCPKDHAWTVILADAL